MEDTHYKNASASFTWVSDLGDIPERSLKIFNASILKSFVLCIHKRDWN